jgi:hypothetical protein
VQRSIENLAGWSGTIESQELSASAHAERAKKANNAQVVVSVKVRKESGVNTESGSVANHLSLTAFSAVEQQQFTPGLERQTGDIAMNGRRCCRRAQKRQSKNRNAAGTHR